MQRLPEGTAAGARRERVCTIRVGDAEHCIDPLGPLFEALGRKWSLLIVAVLGNERTMRFHQLQAALLGVSPRTLSDRLKDLERVGLLRRRIFAEVPPRVEYSLTARGEALRESLVPMLRWAERNE